ncbi:LOW QUALITY PROTEIN: partitioning defective 3 homolog [Centruroides vittatus]|uniref:LOW QUALITY PROTEIN: partitioning defective 3 homolog n=1 Tax=Centruroides vittatus TaxID=120091 RepID=UPI0035101890
MRRRPMGVLSAGTRRLRPDFERANSCDKEARAEGTPIGRRRYSVGVFLLGPESFVVVVRHEEAPQTARLTSRFSVLEEPGSPSAGTLVMKVTVNFGSVRVIVPCGRGDILVRELTELAVTRYKKATGKPSCAWVAVRNLKSVDDGGILDPDDRLSDVADDREQIVADFEERPWPPAHHPGDGTSSSSAGTGSPDIFRSADEDRPSGDLSDCVDVRLGRRPPLGVAGLRVRRGSEPALNRLSPPVQAPDRTKRWSAALVVEDPARAQARKEPLGGSSPERDPEEEEEEKREEGEEESEEEESSGSSVREALIALKNEAGPLGIHVVPDYDRNGRDCGLLVQGIEPGGRIDRDGRLRVSDRIVEINGRRLSRVGFRQAQDIFKEALKAPEIRLRLVRAPADPLRPAGSPSPEGEQSSEETAVRAEERGEAETKVATVTPTKKVPPGVPHRNPNAALTANTRKIGRRIRIQLTKGAEGLGFSVTTRDNPAGGNCPIYVKNILPKGAAVRDGRLKPGDRLLEVNGVEMTGKSQTEAVSVLRNTPLGGTVELVVSRQEPDLSPSSSARESMSEKNGEQAWKRKEILTFEIPLNDFDFGSTGLGVSVKGKTSTGQNGSVDLGIFVKSVIEGGAAFKDGRLKTDDRLIDIDGTSLLGMSNGRAMEALRRAISPRDGVFPPSITLSVRRRVRSVASHPARAPAPGLSDSDSGCLGGKEEECRPPSDATAAFLGEGRKNDDFRKKSRDPEAAAGSGWGGTLETPSGETVLIQTDVPDWSSRAVFCPCPCPAGDPKVEKSENTSDGRLSSEDISFCRDGFGRQSISEKRHAQLDAKNTDTYQRNKKARAERDRHKSDSTDVVQSEEQKPAKSDLEENIGNAEGELKPALNLMRSNSADSLVSLKQCNNEKFKGKSSGKYHRNHKFFSSSCCWNCQSPGCPYHAVTLIGGDGIINKNSLVQLGPSLGMRKSSSLESLQTMVHELQKREEVNESISHPATRVIRGRGCNESFRAAVDRSYEAPVAEMMETLEEESESGSSSCQVANVLSRPNFISHNSRMAENSTVQDEIIDPYQRKDIKIRKKGIFKGLGSVFKFGKNKKLCQESVKRLTKEELEQEAERLKARLAAKEEQEKIQEEYRKLLEKQRQQQENYLNNSNPSLPAVSQNRETISGNPNLDLLFLSSSRQERMQQLRAHHQRRHQERHGLYPQDEQEEWYEQEIKEKIDKKQITKTRKPLPSIPLQQISQNYSSQRRVFPKRYETEMMHSRSQSFDIYREMERPGSRMGIAADPNKYSHYMNYKEIQQHLRQIQQNQNQNVTRKERPISNYYEYESATHQQPSVESHTNSLPRRSRIPSSQFYGKAQITSLFHNRQSKHEEPRSGRNYDQQYQVIPHFTNTTESSCSEEKKDASGSKV